MLLLGPLGVNQSVSLSLTRKSSARGSGGRQCRAFFLISLRLLPAARQAFRFHANGSREGQTPALGHFRHHFPTRPHCRWLQRPTDPLRWVELDEDRRPASLAKPGQQLWVTLTNPDPPCSTRTNPRHKPCPVFGVRRQELGELGGTSGMPCILCSGGCTPWNNGLPRRGTCWGGGRGLGGLDGESLTCS